MIEAIVAGITCWLLTEQPDWNSDLTADFASATGRDQGLTQREARVRLASATELTLGWRATLEGEEGYTLQRQLEAYDNRPILVPFWPAFGRLSDIAASPWGDGLRLFCEPDMSAWQILAGVQAPTSFAPSANCLSVPLAWCAWAKSPSCALLRPDVHQVTFSVVESGLAAYAIAPRPQLFPDGPLVGAAARPVLDLAPEWSDSPDQSITIRINRKKLGHARGQAEEYYDQVPLQQRKAGFVLGTAAQAARLLDFFRQAGGMARPWWSGQHDACTHLVAAAAGLELEVESAARLAGVAAVYIVSPGGDVAVRSVASIDGATITLSAPVDMPADSLVAPATLCRFSADKLRLSFTDTQLAKADVETITLPTEAADVLGYEGATAALLVVTDGANTWRWTDYDAPIDAGALGVFEPRRFEVGEITEEINLEEHGTTLELLHFEGNPFARLLDGTDHAELVVTIYVCDPDLPASATALFTARAAAPKTDGPFMTVSLSGFAGLLDVKGPRQLMQDTCCAVFGDSRCRAANPGISLTVSAVSGQAVDFVLPSPAPASELLPCGYVERPTATGGVQRFTTRTATIVDGVIRLELAGVLAPIPTEGEIWTAYIGCDGTYGACGIRGNTANFRGFPYIPSRNPSITPVTTTTSGKK